jgi:hydroxymethylbilane synthase
VFASALRDALLAGACDAIVHSLKDLPTAAVEGLRIGAVPQREDPRDALCARDGLTLATLPTGARVGTGSPRRRAALLAARPDLDVIDIRGNVDTRLRRIDADSDARLDAVVLAASGLTRLGRLDAVTELLDFAVSPQAPGQGALAVEVRTDDSSPELAAALAAIEHVPTRVAVTAERALLSALEAGCAAPIGASGALVGSVVELTGVVFATDGSAQLARFVSEPSAHHVPQVRASTGMAPVSQYGESDLPVVEAALRVGLRLADALLAAGASDLAPLGVHQ